MQQLLSSLDQPGPPTINLNQAGLVGLTPERVLMNRCIVQGGSGIVNMDAECASKLLLDIQKLNCGLNKADVGKGKKRKLSDMSDLADSTNCPDTEPTTSTGAGEHDDRGRPGRQSGQRREKCIDSKQPIARTVARRESDKRASTQREHAAHADASDGYSTITPSQRPHQQTHEGEQQ